jgi:hypothetical protein
LLAASSPLAHAQNTAAAKSNAIAASFSKFKRVTKDKHGFRKEKYARVESEPAPKSNPVEYSGRYEVNDLNFVLRLSVNPDGTFVGTGYDPLTENVKRTFTLKNGRIQSALLTATKVYANGETEPFEGAFMNRTRYESPTDKGVTVFGFGTLGRAVNVGGLTIDKFFYEKTS